MHTQRGNCVAARRGWHARAWLNNLGKCALPRGSGSNVRLEIAVDLALTDLVAPAFFQTIGITLVDFHCECEIILEPCAHSVAEQFDARSVVENQARVWLPTL